jgi:DNA-binding MarR family transcriptional regulator
MPALTVGRKELLVNGDDELFRQAVHDALAFGARLEEIRNRLSNAIGLGGPAYSILVAIDHLTKAGDVSVKRVGEHLHLSGAFVTNELNKLVEAGLVTKRTDRQDRRRVILTATKKARSLLVELSAIQQPVNDAIFSEFTAAQFIAFSSTIAALVRGTENALALLHFQAEQRRRQA